MNVPKWQGKYSLVMTAVLFIVLSACGAGQDSSSPASAQQLNGLWVLQEHGFFMAIDKELIVVSGLGSYLCDITYVSESSVQLSNCGYPEFFGFSSEEAAGILNFSVHENTLTFTSPDSSKDVLTAINLRSVLETHRSF